MADRALRKLHSRRREAGPQDLRTRDRRRPVWVTVSKASGRERAASGWADIQSSGESPLLIRCRYGQRRSGIQFMAERSRGPGPVRRQSGGSQAALL